MAPHVEIWPVWLGVSRPKVRREVVVLKYLERRPRGMQGYLAHQKLGESVILEGVLYPGGGGGMIDVAAA